MANRRQLVRRRKSVRNIQKITRTMQLIATARFQQAMSRASATRPYAEKLAEMVEAARASLEKVDHPLLRENPDAPKSAMIVITSNRGFAGSYNGNVLRLGYGDIRERRAAGATVDLTVVGKKGINYLSFLGVDIHQRIGDVDERPRFEQIAPLADKLMEAYRNGEYSSVQVAYMRFISTGVQRPHIMPLLPLRVEAAADAEEEKEIAHTEQFDFSPEPEELLEELLPATVRMRLFQAFTDAAVSEQVARMVAMKAATDAAGDMIRVLTQKYNRARQTAITMELLDIIGGAAAIE